ncbi:hypothetical protein [Arsenicicoccus dermatophilus]|uniref:hypothetical protein n=1 Tax=Arsenicicoccus dermatophilus TaxID=1076331 RepID=UPI001F4C5A92|nr:hypothetical protein [Arsenicicoccus dermatophilus]MCH8613059.1 hypothetical protein [Arsenicicoccus dermatophilus]
MAARTIAAASVAGVVVGSLVCVLLISQFFPVLRLTDRRPTPTTTVSRVATTAPQPTAARAPAAPAAAVVTKLLQSAPAGLPPGLDDSASVPGTVAPAVAPSCDTPVAPVLSRSRTWAAPPGSPGAGGGVTITATVYSAGAGAPAMDAMLLARKQCIGDATVTKAPGPGVQAVRASRTKGKIDTRSVVFRRGDVVVSVSGTGMPVPEDVATDVDERLQQLLGGGVCADPAATTADFSRSPLVERRRWTGLQVAASVDLPGQGTPLPELAVAHAATPLPAPVTPTPPAAPYWPESAPAPVPSPSEPTAPAPYPVRTTYPSPAPDRTGPGCGWAFTGMTPPTYDEQAAARTVAERRDAAIAGMRDAVAAYPAAVQAYEQAWTAYQAQAQAWTTYATQAQQVETAWAAIRTQQEAYRQALADYQKAVTAYDEEIKRRTAAQQAYDAEVLRCSQGPTGLPWPPGPFPPPLPPGCPPQRDPILDEPMPTTPTSPAPPPDPRPTPRP